MAGNLKQLSFESFIGRFWHHDWYAAYLSAPSCVLIWNRLQNRPQQKGMLFNLLSHWCLVQVPMTEEQSRHCPRIWTKLVKMVGCILIQKPPSCTKVHLQMVWSTPLVLNLNEIPWHEIYIIASFSMLAQFFQTSSFDPTLIPTLHLEAIHWVLSPAFMIMLSLSSIDIMQQIEQKTIEARWWKLSSPKMETRGMASFWISFTSTKDNSTWHWGTFDGSDHFMPMSAILYGIHCKWSFSTLVSCWLLFSIDTGVKLWHVDLYLSQNEPGPSFLLPVHFIKSHIVRHEVTINNVRAWATISIAKVRLSFFLRKRLMNGLQH